MIKIVVPNLKPRAKELNAALVAKRCVRHQDRRFQTRQQAKQELFRALNAD